MSDKKAFSLVTWLIVIAAVSVGGWYGMKVYKKSKEKPMELRSAKITRGDIIQQVTANGQITPVKNVAIGTQVSGIINELYVDFNSKVTNGQVIAVIDPSTYKQNIASSEADLANATAALEYAIVNHKRAKELVEAKLIAANDYDKAVADLHQAQAVVKVREASLSKSKVDLERTMIYAPIDGIVISRNVDVGQTVAASFSTPTLFQIANDLRNMQIEAMVSEADVGGVLEGQKVNFNVDAFQGRQFRGEIRQVRFAPITNQNVVNYVCVVDVNNDDLRLRPGMTAYAYIITAQKRDALRIPNAALNFRPPTNAIITGITNVAKAAGGSNAAPAAVAGTGGAGGGDREEMRRRFESMSPEERAQMRERFRAMGGGGGGGGGGRGGGMGRAAPDGPVTKTVYLLEKEAKTPDERPVLKAVTVKIGITDGNYSEVLEGVKEDDVLVTGIVTPAVNPAMANAPQGRSPFGGPFGGGGGGGMRGPR